LGEQINVPQLDPIGGAVLSSYIIFEWCKTLLENFSNLSGRMADSEEYSRVIYLATRVSATPSLSLLPLVRCLTDLSVCATPAHIQFKGVDSISNVVVYHHGDELNIEIDLCLPAKTPLPQAHDLGEVMQTSIEALENVSRAFTHLDYSRYNPPQHLTAEQQRARRSILPDP
jgi:divalent metal cation (Fe/Co/Zn/Cd) transporter